MTESEFLFLVNVRITYTTDYIVTNTTSMGSVGEILNEMLINLILCY